MEWVLGNGLAGLVLVGGGFLLPWALLRYFRREYEPAAIAATIVFWASIPLVAIEAGALAVSMEEHGAPLLRLGEGPTPGLLPLAYPPFAFAAALLLRRASRRRIEEREIERMGALGDAFIATVVVDKDFKDRASVVRGKEDGTPGPDQVIRQGDRVHRAD